MRDTPSWPACSPRWVFWGPATTARPACLASQPQQRGGSCRAGRVHGGASAGSLHARAAPLMKAVGPRPLPCDASSRGRCNLLPAEQTGGGNGATVCELYSSNMEHRTYQLVQSVKPHVVVHQTKAGWPPQVSSRSCGSYQVLEALLNRLPATGSCAAPQTKQAAQASSEAAS